MRMLIYADRKVVTDRTYPLTENLYFRNELRMLLAQAGLIVEAEFGDWTDAVATADHAVITFVARKSV